MCDDTAIQTIITGSSEPAPGMAAGPSPAQGATNVITTTSLAWTSAAGASPQAVPLIGVTSYDVYFGMANPPSLLSSGITATSYALSSLLYATTYYWRIDTRNSAGTTQGAVWSFTTQMPPPVPVAQPAPTDNATNCPLTIPLAWNAVSNAVSYDIYFGSRLGTSSAPPYRSTVTGTSYTVSMLTYNTVYWWRVDARNSTGTAIGHLWSFQTQPSPPVLPAIASAPEPPDNAAGISANVQLSWTAADATSYNVYFGTTNPPPYKGNVGGAGYNINSLAVNTTYYWRIDSRNSSAVTTGNIWRFTTQLPLPAAVAGPVPANNSVDVSITPQLSWLASADTASYAVYFGTTTTGWTPVTNTVLTFFNPSVLSYNTQYYWRIDSQNPVGTTLGNICSFTTISTTSVVNLPPAPAGSPSPPDVATDVITATPLAWAAADNATSYDVYFGTTTAGWTPVTNTVLTSYAPGALLYAQSYYWRIDSRNSAGVTAGNIWRFTTMSILPPAAPVLTGPLHNETEVSITPQLIWTAGVNVASYDVYFGTTTTGWTPVTNTALTFFSPSVLSNNTQYYWRIDAKNSAGTTQGAVWRFTTRPPAPAAGAGSPSPLDEAHNIPISVQLSWSAAPGATAYDVYFGTTSQPPFRITTSGTTYNPGLLVHNTAYYWRVAARNSAGVNLGAYWRFYTLGPPAKVSSVSPANYAENVVSATALAWVAVASASSYDVYFGSSYPPAYITNTALTSYAPGALLYSHTYYWRVDAHNETGVAQGDICNFTTQMPHPATPTNLTAVAVPASARIDLAWLDNSGQESGFRIERSTDGANYVLIADLPINAVSWSDTAILRGVLYYYRVRAYNETGQSHFVTPVTASLPLPAPATLSTTAVSSSQINLTWADSSNTESGFRIERKAWSDGTWTAIATMPANTTAYPDMGVADGITYYYRVRAFNSAFDSVWSVEKFSSTPFNTPESLLVNAVSPNRIDLAWTDLSNGEDGFRIERKTTLGGVYALIATVPANSTAYSNTGLTDGTTYYYRLKAFSNSFESAYSSEASLTTPVSPPVSLVATVVSSSQIDINWTDTSNVETGFIIERKDGDAGSWVQAGTRPANTTTWSNGGRTDGTRYYYRVKAYITGLESAWSNEANAITPLNPPTGLTALVISISQINLAWTDNSGGEDGYRIERSFNGSVYCLLTTVTGASYSDTTVTPTNTYYYKVKAYNTLRESTYSNVASSYTAAPPAPTNLITTTNSASSIALQWADNSNNETGFEVWRSLDGANYSLSATLPANSTTWTDVGLLMSTAYAYKVRAYNGINNSNWSNTINQITLSPPAATGGTITYSGDYKIHTFTSGGTFTVTGGGNVEVLVVAGGGGGGNDMGGGGGGGGVLYSGSYSVVPNAMTVTVGNGGAGSPGPYANTPVSGSNGQNSVFGSLTAIGGGGGGSGHRTDAPYVGGGALVGGSGGGSAARYMYGGAGQTFGAVGTAGQGTAGGNSPTVNNDYYAGGGGGAGGNSQVDAVNATRAGHGGPGLQFSISGTSYYYGGGGGGGAHTGGPAGNGGLGGGGGGSTWSSPSTAGSGGTGGTSNGGDGAVGTPIKGGDGGVNTGGGGGGGSHQGNGGNGGSGIVIIRYFNSGNNVTTNLVAKVNSDTEIVLTWQDNSPGENGFKIERSPDGSSWAQIDTVPANTTAYTNTGLSAGATYYYRVRSYNFLVDHPYSNQAVAQTVAPLAPSNLITTTVTTLSIGLQWTDNSLGEQGFQLERSLDGNNWLVTYTLSANTTSYNNTELSRDTTYYYRIRSYNGINYSAYSNPISDKTMNLTYIGNGKDGAITLGAGNWHTTNYGNNGGQPEGYSTYINGSVSSGVTLLPVVATTGFNVNDEILVHFGHSTNSTTRDNDAGKYYFTKITAKTASSVTVQDGIPWAVNSSNDRVQVARVPNYTNVTVSGVVTGNGWDWYQYGIICFRAVGTVTFNSGGQINFNKLGYKNLRVASDSSADSTPGTGYSYDMISANGWGGGGATHGQYGGYGVYSSNTTNAATLWKGRASLLGTVDMSARIYLGPAGGWGVRGHGGTAPTTNQRGGYGGGIVWIGAYTMNFNSLTGCIQVNGEKGWKINDDSSWHTGGGGGAGGSIKLAVYTIQNMVVNSVSATAGGGGAPSTGGDNSGEDGQVTRGGNGGQYSPAAGAGSTSGSGGGAGGHSGAGEAGQATYGGRGGTGNSIGSGGGGGAGRIRIDYHTINGSPFNGLVPIPAQSPTVGYAIDGEY